MTGSWIKLFATFAIAKRREEREFAKKEKVVCV